MQNRTRKRQLNLKFTEEEFDYIAEKKRLAQAQNYTDFILKTAAHSQVFIVDTKPLFEISNQINKIGTNINQIAKAVNTTHNIYKNDIEDMREKICSIENIIKRVFDTFTAAQKGSL